MTTARDDYRQALAELAHKAQQTLPELNGRISGAVKLVLAGDIHMQPDGSAHVASSSNPLTIYKVNNSCTCRDFTQAPRGLCKHRLSAIFTHRLRGLLPGPTQPTPEDDPWPEAPVSDDNDDLPPEEVDSTAQKSTIDPQDVPTEGREGEVANLPTPDTKNSGSHQQPLLPAPGSGPGQSLGEAPASATVRLSLAGHQDILFTLRDHDERRLLGRLEALLQRFPVASQPLVQSPAQAPQHGWCAKHGVQMKLNHKDGRSWYSHQTADGHWCKGK